MSLTTTLDTPRNASWIVPALGLAWNAFGIYQFVTSTTASAETLVARGMTPEQAALYTSLPAWMTLAFAAGVFGGFLGILLLLLRRASAVPVLAASLASYVVLFAGDITQGVFAAFGPPQVAILTVVLLIATGLLVFAVKARRSGLPG